MSTLSRRQPLLWGLAGLLLVVLLVLRAPGFSGTLLGAFILACVCAPAVDRLAPRLPRAFAAGLVLFVVGAVVLGMLLLFVPLFTSQYGSVAERLPQILDWIGRLVPRIEASLAAIKSLLHLRGLCSPAVFPPLLPVSPVELEALRGEASRLRLT